MESLWKTLGAAINDLVLYKIVGYKSDVGSKNDNNLQLTY